MGHPCRGLVYEKWNLTYVLGICAQREKSIDGPATMLIWWRKGVGAAEGTRAGLVDLEGPKYVVCVACCVGSAYL